MVYRKKTRKRKQEKRKRESTSFIELAPMVQILFCTILAKRKGRFLISLLMLKIILQGIFLKNARGEAWLK